MIDWRERAQRLAAELVRRGVLTDRGWRSALVATPRHLLVPEFFRQTPDLSGWYRVAEADPATRDEWGAAVYTDTTLVTLLRERPGEHGGYPVAVSSSTRPSLMLTMLSHLSCQDGMRVLEVGTGCGYNAALLCSRLGDTQVVSVDVDAELVSAARRRLADCGLHPALHTADARTSLPPGPFDRLVTTCAVEQIPSGWLDVINTGGVVLAPLSAPLADGTLVRLRMQRDGTATGRIIPLYAPFMAARATDDTVATPTASPAAPARSEPRRTDVDPALLAPDHPFAFWAQQFLPPLAPRRTGVTDDGRPVTMLFDHTGRWARAWNEDGFVVTTSGPSDLWSMVERSYRRWVAAGRPGWERFGLTVSRQGQTLWLDSTDTPVHSCGEP